MDRDSPELARLVADLDELLEERSRELGRPMRGAEREQLRRKYERLEARLRERISELRGDAPGGEFAPRPSGDPISQMSIFSEQETRYDA